jgi:hypothetical protein
VALVLRHVIRHIGARWPAVEIIVRGDSDYRRPEGPKPDPGTLRYFIGAAEAGFFIAQRCL